MPELEREEIFLQRFEEVQRIKDRRNLDRMLKAQKDGDGDSVAKAAKCIPSTNRIWSVYVAQHAGRGAAKAKLRNELKAKRKMKNERKRERASRPRSPLIHSEFRGSPMHDRSLSPMDLETSDEEAEVIKPNQEEKEHKLPGITVHNDNDEPITISDINKVRLTRDTLAKYFLAPWFKDYVKGVASTVFSMPLFDDTFQERMYVILWEGTNIVFMRFVVRAPSNPFYIR